MTINMALLINTAVLSQGSARRVAGRAIQSRCDDGVIDAAARNPEAGRDVVGFKCSAGRLHVLMGPRDSGSLVEGLRRNVGAVRPGDCAAVEKKSCEAGDVLQRFEHRPFEPGGEIDNAIRAIVERQVNPKAFFVLSTHNAGKKHHGESSSPRGLSFISHFT